jgi:hypothetical protein
MFLVFMFAAVVVVVMVLYLRHKNLQMLHQERLVALEKGVSAPAVRALAPWSPRVYLLRGLIWSASGLALMICLLGLAVTSHRPASAESLAYRTWSISKQFDITRDEARQMAEKDQATEQRGMPFSVALLGLIPLGVGIAYLVFYYSDESRKNPLPEPAPAPSRTGLGLT